MPHLMDFRRGEGDGDCDCDDNMLYDVIALATRSNFFMPAHKD